MKILVTGGAGYIGSILVPHLLQNGHEVTVIDNLMYQQTSLLDCCHDHKLKIVRGREVEELADSNIKKIVNSLVDLGFIKEPIGQASTGKDQLPAAPPTTPNKKIADLAEARKSNSRQQPSDYVVTDQTKGVGSRSEVLAVLQQKFTSFSQAPLSRAVERLSRQMENEAKTQDKMKQSFYEAVNNRQADRAIAALVALLRQKGLRPAFVRDQRFIDFWSKHLARHQQSSTEFQQDPAAPKFIIAFIKELLERRFGLSVKDSALVGMTLGRCAKEGGEEEYAYLAYGDLLSGEFKWNT